MLNGKTVLVLGADGYIGWPLCNYLKSLGARVVAVDNCVKRQWELAVKARPIAKAPPFEQRFAAFDHYKVDVCSRNSLYTVMDNEWPDVVVHLAEQPSAPLSMLSRGWAVETQRNNVIGTLNLIYGCAHLATAKNVPIPHIVKLGSMGEYGTPPIQIDEGWLEYKGYRFPFPKQPGSIYHLSKVHDSNNLEFACRTWGFRVTDVNQGIVWGTETWDTPFMSPALRTAFHVDAVFGTVLNRFVAQAAIGAPLTVYGTGAQTRGFIHLSDTIRCMALAIAQPPADGEFRVINQFTDILSVQQLAETVSSVSGVPILHLENPRVESENHKYQVVCEKMDELGFDGDLAKSLSAGPVANMISQLQAMPGLKRRAATIRQLPEVKWRRGGLAPHKNEGEGI